MTTRRPLDTTEWLEDMRRFAGRDAERAAALLEELAVLEELRDVFNRTIDAPLTSTVDHADVREIRQRLREADGLRGICVEAGLIKKGDWKTDPLPFLRMFLPVD